MTQHLIDRISKTIGLRAARRFELAIQKRSTTLYERAIKPQLATDIGGEWAYLPMGPVYNWSGRSPKYTFDVFDGVNWLQLSTNATTESDLDRLTPAIPALVNALNAA